MISKMLKSSLEFKLKDIRGIGESVSNKLLTYFGSEKNALVQISKGYVLSLTQAGLSEKKALNIIKEFKFALTGETIENPLLSSDIAIIYDKILKVMQGFAKTEYSKSKILLNFVPHTNGQFELIQKNRIEFEDALLLYSMNKDNAKDIQKIYEGFKTLQAASMREFSPRKLLTTIPEIKNILQNLKISDYCPVELITSVEDIIDDDADELIFLLTEHEINEVDHHTFIILPDNAIENPWWHILPEKIFYFYLANLSTLKKSIKLCNLLIVPENIEKKFNFLNNEKLIEELNIIEQNLCKFSENGHIVESNTELARLRHIMNNFDSEVGRLQDELNAKIEAKIENMNIKLEGQMILEILQSPTENYSHSTLNNLLENSLGDILNFEISSFEENLINKMSLSFDETELVRGIFSLVELQLPLEINEEILSNFMKRIQKKLALVEFRHIQNLAKSLETFRMKFNGLVLELLNTEYYLAIGAFSSKFNLKLPTLSNNHKGINFVNAKNLFLVKEHGWQNIEPITYKIGNIEPLESTNIVLLSGANSGGKTSLLQLLAQIILLGQMGLGVPAESCTLSIFDQIFYYQKPSGNADTGAFETALKNFSKIVEDEKKSKLVLADEMEAISEPDASARVISAFLDVLGKQNTSNCGIFVSHLADQIAKNCSIKIRIDGIEATGLDENLHLIVDRNPKINYHARSTPQLIVESLIKRTKGKEKVFFQEILNKF